MSNQNQYQAIGVWVLLWKWRKIIIGATVAGALVSAAVSFTLTDYYKSVAIIFPAKTSSVLVGKNLASRDNVTDFGEEEQAEQLLQILQSADIRERIISKYNLMEHYGIEADENFATTKLNKEYRGNISFSRTKFGSIEIEVLDKDPEMAASIANDIVELLDSAKNRMIRDRVLEPLRIVENQYNDLFNEMEELIHQMGVFADSGVVSGQERASLIDALAEARKNRDAEEEVRLRKQIAANNKYGASSDALSVKRLEKTRRLEELKEVYEQMLADAQIAISHKFVVEYATPAEKKSYPVRSLIVLVSTFAAFALAVILVLFIHRIREIQEAARKS
jgi:uncharacterized protein involved in exopolysaccharide biosynthesis